MTLESVASATKINQSLLAALERNDLSRWPKGIFRRAFLRAYATAIGLRPEEVLVEFLRLFPEDEQQADPYVTQPAGELRLTLAVEHRLRVRVAFIRGLATILDLGLVLLAGGIAAWFSSQTLWNASGIVGMVYYPLMLVWLGQPLFSHWFCGDGWGHSGRPWAQSLHRNNQLRIVSRRPNISQPIPLADHASGRISDENRRTGST
jgi:hypothetical protein